MDQPVSLRSLRPGARIHRILAGKTWTPGVCLAATEIDIRDSRITAVGPAEPTSSRTPAAPPDLPAPPPDSAEVDASDALVVPGLLDVHMHGAGGGDALFGETAQVDLLRHAAARGGATGLVVVVPYYTSDRDFRRFRASIEALRASHAPGARILGVHLETPFINPAKRGGFPPDCCHPIDLALFRRLLELGDGLIRVMTLAPELPGMETILEAAIDAGIRVSLGHSEATAEQARLGFELGADRVTHTFNTMNPLHHREIGLVGAAFLDRDVFLEVIPDGVHLCPDALRLLGGLFPAERLVAITDANAGAGMPEGYQVRAVGGTGSVKDGAMRLDDGTLAGSILLMAGALKNLIHLAGMAPRAALECCSLTPARSVGLDDDYGSIEEGKSADLALLDPRTFDPRATVVGGEVVWTGD